MEKFILSICIPTYSRANYLKECLEAITLQFEQNQNLLTEVEVIVSDNASLDNTVDVVNIFQKKYKNIKYVCNAVNLGSDENYINSVIKASGKYCWLIGDDDYIINGGIDFVVKFLEKNEVSILTVNTRSFVDLVDVFKKQENIMEDKISFFTSYDEFFKKNYCLGILCTIIFNRELWLSTDRRDYSPGWSYYEISLKMIAISDLSMAHLAHPMVITREDCLWVKGGTELVYFITWKKVLKKIYTFGYDKKFIKAHLAKFPNSLFIILLHAKGHDLHCSWDNYYKFIFSEFKDYPIRLFFASILYVIPNKIIKLIRDLNKKVFKIKI